MKSNYSQLGKYIREIDIRNSDLAITNLLGVSMEKTFIPSVANLNGVDLSIYKVLKRGQLACKLMSVGRDKKLPVDLYLDEKPAIISSAYYVFEPKNNEELLPEYLILWLCRPENDRYIGFISGGDVRGGISWETFCSLPIKVPSIEKQREIVEEYNTIQNRITLNQNLIQKLESTAQAIYKEWFVDFEFPNEEGKPYKTNGGEMVWNEELGKEIPKGWEVMKISSICEITSSKRIFESEYQEKGIPFYRGKEITQKKLGEVISDIIYISKERYNEIVKKYGKPNKGDILMTAVGTLGSTYMVEDEDFYFKDGNVIWFKNFKIESSNYFLYDFMQTKQFADLINEITIGSTQSAITIKSFEQQKIVFPNQIILERYINLSIALNKNQDIKKKEQLVLNKLKELLLSKLSTN